MTRYHDMKRADTALYQLPITSLLLAVLLLVPLAAISISQIAYDSTMEINNPASDKSAQIAFNTSFANGTIAVMNQIVDTEKANLIIAMINAIINEEDISELEELQQQPDN
jgi:maltodextrin utilization protein YvdJ